MISAFNYLATSAASVNVVGVNVNLDANATLVHKNYAVHLTLEGRNLGGLLFYETPLPTDAISLATLARFSTCIGAGK